MRVVVAITGASGVVIGKRLVEELAKLEVELHLIISKGAEDVGKYEESTDFKEIEDIAAYVYDEKDLSSRLSSSSFIVDAMVVVPCSMKTLSAIANGYCDNLISRCAENALKMGWKLITVPRDTPLSLPAIENMRKLKMAGAIILPPNLSFYTNPRSIDEALNFIVGKIIDSLGIDHKLYARWDGNGCR